MPLRNLSILSERPQVATPASLLLERVWTTKTTPSLLPGLAQGDPLSPALWVIVADMALSHARKLAPTKEGSNQVAGFKLADLADVPDCVGTDQFSVPAAYRKAGAVGTSVLAYADDLCAIGESKEEALFIAQRMVTLLGAINIRVQAKKCVYMRSLQAAINADAIQKKRT